MSDRPWIDGTRKRAARACLNCRHARVKCELPDGSFPSENSTCARCKEYEIECQFVPSRRLGRQKRKEHGGLRPESGTASSSSASGSGSTPDPFASTAANAALITATKCLTRLSDSSSLLISPSQFVLDPFISLVNEYKYNVHHYIPIFPSNDQQLEVAIRNASPLLISSILVMSFPEASDEPEVPPICLTLPDIQAAALLTLSHYGRQEYFKAKRAIMSATAGLTQLGVSSMDSATSLHTQCPLDDLTKEMWRRVWWECWALEIFISAIPGMEQDVIVLNLEDTRPSLPRWSSTSSTSEYQDDSDSIYMQSMGLLYQVVRTFSQPTDQERISQLSNAGASIYALARQNWAAASSHVSTSYMSPQGSDVMGMSNRERSLFASLLSATAIVFLHLNQSSVMVNAIDTDIKSDPSPGTPRFLGQVCQMVFRSLRDAFNFYSSLSMLSSGSTPSAFSPNKPPSYSPLFSTLLKFTAVGSFHALSYLPALQSSDENAQIARAAIIVDLQLAETSIAKQAMRWLKSKVLVREIKDLRRKMQESITSTAAKAIIGA